jgi:hypothetical protein
MVPDQKIIRVELTIKEIENTTTFKSAGWVLQNIFRTPLYVRGASDWLTLVKYKGLDHVLSLHHMDEFRKSLVIELCRNKGLIKGNTQCVLF